jgi:hypothetical protein
VISAERGPQLVGGDIRRPGLELRVEVQRVHLVYEGGKLKPIEPDMKRAVRATEQNPTVVTSQPGQREKRPGTWSHLRGSYNCREKVPGVEVLFQ